MKYNVNELYDWPLIPKGIVIVLICLLIFYLAYFLDFSDITARLHRLEQQEQDLKMQVTVLSNNVNTTKVELAKFPGLMNSLTATQQKIINSKELPELLNEILKIGRQNELEFNQFNPGPEVKEGAYVKVAIKAVMLGSYDQIGNFISQIANLDKMVSIANFTIGKPVKPNQPAEATIIDSRLLADIMLEVYEVKKT